MLSKNYRIIGTGVILILLVIINFIALIWDNLLTTQQHEKEQLRSIAVAAENNVATTFDISSMVLDSLAVSAAQSTRNLASLENLQVHYLKSLPFLLGLALVKNDGVVLASTSLADRDTRLDLNRLFPNLPPEGKNIIIGPWAPGRTLAENSHQTIIGSPVGFIPIARRVTLSESESALLIAQINLGNLTPINQQLPNTSHPGIRIMLAIDDGNILWQWGLNNTSGRIPQKHPIFTELNPSTRDAGYGPIDTMEDRTIGYWRRFQNLPLVSLVERPYPSPREIILSSVQREAPSAAIVLAIIIIIIYGAWHYSRESTALEHNKESDQLEFLQRELEISTILNNSNEIVIWTDINGLIYKDNNHDDALKLTTTGSFIGESLKNLVHPDDRTVIKKLFSTGRPFTKRSAQVRIADIWGEVHVINISVTPLQGRDDQLEGFVGIAMDVTELSTLQKQLKNQLIFSETLLESVPLAIFMTDLDDRYLYVNQAWEHLTGLGRDRVLGLKGCEFLPPDTYFNCDDDSAASDSVKRVQVADGRISEMRIIKIRRFSHDGQPLGALFIMLDIPAGETYQALMNRTPSSTNDDFIIRVNQELRHPLQTILGYSELGMMRGRADPRSMFTEIHAAGRSMLEFLSESISTLDLHFHIDSFNFENCDVRVLIDEICNDFESTLVLNCLTLERLLSPSPLVAKVDRTRFSQVLRHLLNNAVLFSPEGQLIQVSASNDKGNIHISVYDKGAGRSNGSEIKTSEIHAVFNTLNQPRLEYEPSNPNELDLGVCQKIIKAHAGSLFTMNAEEGGVIFHIILPVSNTVYHEK